MSESDPAEMARLRDHLRGLEARLDAWPREMCLNRDDIQARKALMREVWGYRGLWRQKEAAIGRRAAGMGVGPAKVDPNDTAKLSALTKGYRTAAKRNTGKRISGDIAEFEQRVRQMYGFDPNQTRLTKASSRG